MPGEERLMFAMSVVTLIPLFLVFLLGQQFLVKASPPPAESDSVRDLV
jgi:ABC-type glycerol-3-phosphate transport system permease component